MASNSFKIKNSLVLTPKDLATLVSPEAGDLACDINDSNKIKRYDVNSASWVEVGSGGGVGGTDIFFVQDFESASLASFTQTGLTLSQTDPLHGKVSALLTHQAAVNQSFKQVIPVDRKFRGESMTLRLNCKSSASAGNVTINIYDETNAANIVASEQLQLANDVSGAISQVGFTIPATCASISYTITALPQSGSPVTRIDDVIAELAVTSLLETSVEVPVITAWQGYTPIIAGYTSTSALDFKYRRVGDTIEVQGRYTGVTPLASELQIGLPLGLTIDSTKVAIVKASGNIFVGSTSDADYTVLITGGDSFFNVGLQSPASSNALTPQNANSVYSTTQTYSFFASAPCSGLSATSTKTIPLTQSGLVQEADSQLFAAGNAGQVITTSVTNIPFIAVSSIGSDISWNGTQFTPQVDGIYSITGSVIYTAAATRRIEIYANGVLVKSIGDTTAATSTIVKFDLTERFTAGQIISFRVDSNGGTLVNNATYHYLNIARQGSLKQVSVSPDQKITIPTSELRFEGASSRGTSPSNAIVKFDTLAKLRGDAFTVNNDPVLGTSIVMKKAGKLDVSASLRIDTASSVFQITRNQQTLTSITSTTTEVIATTLAGGGSGSVTLASIAGSVFVNVGDVIRVAAQNVPIADLRTNTLNLSFQEQDISVSVTNTLPQFSESDSSVRVDTANGYGSTLNNKIRRFSNVRDNIGVDVEYLDSDTNGASFTAKSSGIYNISYSDNPNAVGGFIAISRNASSLTASPGSLATAEVLAISATSNTGGYVETVSWQGYLSAGDVVRGQTSGQAAAAIALCNFTMSKVGKPNVTGVNVTPFVNVPQPESQTYSVSLTSVMVQNTILKIDGSGLFATSTVSGRLRVTALKRIQVDAKGSVTGVGSSPIGTSRMYLNGILYDETYTIDRGGTSFYSSATVVANTILNTGEYIEFLGAGTPSFSNSFFSVNATALSDQILTAPETFSTDTAALTYANAATYTLSTLANAPVGTYITFTYASLSNTRTQTTLTNRPTQTDADMNANGMLIYTRAFNAPSTAGNPAMFAIQIGKGLKGKSLDLYKSAGRVTSGSLDLAVYSVNVNQRGLSVKDYNEVTGVLIVDAGWAQDSTVTSNTFLFSDISTQTSGYLVINASKNPALTGMNIERVSARGVQSSGQSIPASTPTTITYDSAKSFDTNASLNNATGVFTAPEAGYYQVNGTILYASTSWTTGLVVDVNFVKNGVVVSARRSIVAGTTNVGGGNSDIIYLKKNDILSMSTFHNNSGAVALISNNIWNQFSITKTNIGGRN